MAARPLAIVSAMHEELRALLPALSATQPVTLAGRHFHVGVMHGEPVVLVLSGIGKVAAATTATLLIQAFDARALVFTGVAGGLGAGVCVGDVVVARQLLQHDMDASPLFPRFEVPLTGRSRFAADALLSVALASASLRCMARATELLGAAHMADFGITDPRVHEGLVLSGDRFVATAAESRALVDALPDALAVEMEGAALAQVCADFDRPFAVLRTISDRADESAHTDFSRFIVDVASVYTRVIVSDWLDSTSRATQGLPIGE
jgi:adenosylhomocysteine nucleosidase